MNNLEIRLFQDFFYGLLRANSLVLFAVVHPPPKGSGGLIVAAGSNPPLKFIMRPPGTAGGLPALTSPL